MSNVIQRLIAGLLALVLLLWAGYHILRFTDTSLQLETVFKDTVPRTISGKCTIVRDEMPLEKTGSGKEHFLYKDGTRIGKGQIVVEYYSGDANTESIQRIHEIDDEIAMLLEAQNKNLNNFSSAPTISRDIREQFSSISLSEATGNCEGIGEVRDELALLVNRREIATGKSSDFNARVSQLQSEKATLKEQSNMGTVQNGYTPESGYFAKKVDGYEDRLTPESIKNFTIDDFIDYSKREISSSDYENTGRIISKSKWYVGVCVPSYQAEDIKPGQKANMSFEDFPGQVPANVNKVMIESDNDVAVILLSSDFINDDIINLRFSDVVLSFSQYTGLRINTSNIRFRENDDGTVDRGVFVLENYMIVFKKIDPIYEEQSFVLSKLNYPDGGTSEYIRLYDQIAQGNDLYDGKIIQ